MSGGRTIWWPKDTAWHRRERIVELGEEFGPVGPLIIDWLSCEAKVQDDGGTVKSGVRSVARGCFTDVVTVRHVLSGAVRVEQLEDFEEANGRFECRISGWKADNERGSAAVRKRAQREREQAGTGSTEPNPENPEIVTSVTERDLSRPVPSSHLREEKRRVKQLPPKPPASGGRQRDRERFEKEIAAWVVANPVIVSDEWRAVRSGLDDRLGPEALVALSSLHLHAVSDEAWVVGVASGQADWLSKRFGSVVSEAAAKTVEFVDCGCEPARAAA